MTKIDLKKELKHLYQPSPKKVVLVDVPRLHPPYDPRQGNSLAV